MTLKNTNTDTTEGEDIVFAALNYAVKAFDEPAVILRSVIFNIGVEVDNDQATAQVDFVLVTETGVFLIETKGWRGNVFNDPDSDTRILLEEFGNTVSVSSPIEQNKRKRKFLQKHLPNVRFHSLGVITGADSIIHHKVKANIIHVNDLAYYLRSQATSRRSEVEKIAENPSYVSKKQNIDTTVDDVALRIIALTDTSKNAYQNHLNNCLYVKSLKNEKVQLAPLALKMVNAKKILVESVSRARNLGISPEEILIELDKCIV
jgi:Nuclease-related domain